MILEPNKLYFLQYGNLSEKLILLQFIFLEALVFYDLQTQKKSSI